MTTTSNLYQHHFINHLRDELSASPPTLHHRRVSLVKRPPLVRSSSPTFNNNQQSRTVSNSSLNNNDKHHNKPKKSVRFCDNASLENVRLFLKTQMPKACKSDPACPKQYTYRLRRPNWPSDTVHARYNRVGGSAIRVEDIQLLSNKDTTDVTLIGTCQVANLAFEKHIVVRYSFDEWTTVHETEAIYQEPIANSANTWDRFRFKIILKDASLHRAHETLYLAAKYNVSGREFWDNNDNKNYQVDIIPEVQLQYQDDLVSSSSSDDEDDDSNTFEDCVDEEDEDEELVQQLQPLSLSNSNKPTTSFSHRYDFNSAMEKPWTPPLSPTTPVDDHPLWSTNTSPIVNSNTTTSNTMNNPYFDTQQKDTNKASSSPVSPQEYNNKFHHQFIHRYCYYNNDRPSIFTPYHSDPPRCSSPTPKAIHS